MEKSKAQNQIIYHGKRGKGEIIYVCINLHKETNDSGLSMYD